MGKKKYNDCHPEIVGIEWTPDNLILVASRSFFWGGSQYVSAKPWHIAICYMVNCRKPNKKRYLCMAALKLLTFSRIGYYLCTK